MAESAQATLVVRGKRFVVIPELEYVRLRRASGEDIDEVDALQYARSSIARDLRSARQAAHLPQAQLARKLRRSQALVSAAERGTKEVGLRYVTAVLKACGLPENWKPAA